MEDYERIIQEADIPPEEKRRLSRKLQREEMSISELEKKLLVYGRVAPSLGAGVTGAVTGTVCNNNINFSLTTIPYLSAIYTAFATIGYALSKGSKKTLKKGVKRVFSQLVGAYAISFIIYTLSGFKTDLADTINFVLAGGSAATLFMTGFSRTGVSEKYLKGIKESHESLQQSIYKKKINYLD